MNEVKNRQSYIDKEHFKSMVFSSLEGRVANYTQSNGREENSKYEHKRQCFENRGLKCGSISILKINTQLTQISILRYMPSLLEALGRCPLLNGLRAKLHKCNPNAWKVGTEDAPQGYLWLHSKLEVNLNLLL